MAYLDFIGNVITRVQATVVSLGVSSAGALVGLNASGKLDSSVLPNGIGADTQAIIASEALAAGDLINIYDNAGTANCRKADNSNGRQAHGYVSSAVANAAVATVFFDGTNSAITSPLGIVYLGTSGGVTAAAPTASGTTIQQVGVVGSGGLAFQQLINILNQ